MGNTNSICSNCFMQIPAVADPFDDICPMLYKICPVHGMQRGKLEKDRAFYQRFNTYKRYNHYPIGVINITGKCNIKCKYCFYPTNNEEMPIERIHEIIEGVYPKLTGFVLSGGEPTCHSQYFEIIKRLSKAGLTHSMLTNGVKLNDDEFFHEAVRNGIIDERQRVRAQLSIHGARQQGEEVYNHQISFLEKCRRRGISIQMVMINLEYRVDGHSIMDETDNVIAFMQEWRDVVPNWRIRTVCNVWAAQNVQYREFNSDIFKQFQMASMRNKVSFNPTDAGDINNIYAIVAEYDGMNIAFMAAPDLGSIDLGYLARGPFMLANDGEWYSVPHALLINQGLQTGWYRGKRGNLPANN